MIYQLPFHHPIRLAQDLATLDQLSHGRLEFGTGTGVIAHEFLRWNLSFEERHEMSAEALEIIVQAWTQDTVTYQGKYWQFDEALPNSQTLPAAPSAHLGGGPQCWLLRVRRQTQLSHRAEH